MLRNVLVGGCGFFWVLALAGMAASLDAASTKTLWGAASVSVLGVYYVSLCCVLSSLVALSLPSCPGVDLSPRVCAERLHVSCRLRRCRQWPRWWPNGTAAASTLRFAR